MLDILLLLGVIGAALAVGGAALLRFVRNFNHREVSPAPMSPIGASAAIPHDLVFLHGGTRIELDSQANTITFVRCHLGNGFWTLRSSPTFTISHIEKAAEERPTKLASLRITEKHRFSCLPTHRKTRS